jgi:hypothetical protein
VAFRNDILRGVRLFLIIFSAVLLGVWVYRVLHAPSDAPTDVQAAAQDAPATSEEAQATPAADADPVLQVSSEPHGLMVPPPPPVGGKRPAVRVVPRPRNDVPPPILPPVVRVSVAAPPSGREFEAPLVVAASPAAPAGESQVTNPAPTKSGVGYKSLIEANANRLPVDRTAAPVPAEESVEQPQKGNRFLRAVGKIFHPGGQKETVLTLQPKQQ